MRAPVRVVELQLVVRAAVKIDYSLELQLQAVHFRLNIQFVFESAEPAAEQPFAARLRF